MGFAQEIRDFTAAYGAVRDIGLKEKDQKLNEKKLNHDIEYDNAMLELKKQEAALKQSKLAKGSGGTGGDGGSGSALPLDEGKKFGPTIFDDNVTTTENRTDGFNDENADAVSGSGKEPPVPDSSDYTDALADEALGYEKGGLVEEEKAAGPFAVGGPPAAPVPEVKPAGKPPAKMPRGALPTEPEPAAPAVDPKAAPAEPAAAAPPAAEKPAAEKPAGGSTPSTVVVRKAMEATGAALDSFEQKYAVPKQAVGGPETDERSDLASGQGGMTFDEYEAIAKTVDPNGEIPRRLQSAANISATYDYFVQKGEPEKAVEVAKAYLVTELRVNQTLGVLAQTAFEDGNVAEGCKILNDACSRFPSGHQIVVQPSDTGRFMYEVIDPEGKVIEKEQIGTDELMESVQGIADGSLYKKMLAQTVVASRPKKGEEAGSYSAALDGVQSAQKALIDAVSAYEAMPEDASLEDRKAAYAKVEALSTGLEEAKRAAKEGGASGFTGKGNRVTHEGNVWSEVEGAGALPDEFALPEAPQAEEPGWWDSMFGGGDKPEAALPTEEPAGEKSALPPAPDNVLQAAKAAIAKGADPRAVAARLKEQGFSAEGL